MAWCLPSARWTTLGGHSLSTRWDWWCRPPVPNLTVLFCILTKSDLFYDTAKMINIFFIPPARISKCALHHREFIVLFSTPPCIQFFTCLSTTPNTCINLSRPPRWIYTLINDSVYSKGCHVCYCHNKAM